MKNISEKKPAKIAFQEGGSKKRVPYLALPHEEFKCRGETKERPVKIITSPVKETTSKKDGWGSVLCC